MIANLKLCFETLRRKVLVSGMLMFVLCLSVSYIDCKKETVSKEKHKPAGETRNANVKSSKIIYLAGSGEHRDLFTMSEDGSKRMGGYQSE